MILSETKIISSPIKVTVNPTGMAQQLTDQILLIGHADTQLNDPQRISDPQAAIDLLNADANSPLLRGFFEAFHSGAKDIILCAAAPMSEFQDVGVRDASFYNTYAARLATTYDVLSQYDYPDIVVPIEAVFHDYNVSTPDFLTPLAGFLDAHTQAGKVMYGLLGVRGSGPLTILIEDTRLDNLGGSGKFVGVVTGEGLFDFPELNTAHTAPLATALAGTIAQLPLNISAAGRIMKAPKAFSSPDRPDAEITIAATAKLIPTRSTVQGRRGAINQLVAATDNTLAPTGSDFAHLSILRLVQKVSEIVRSACAPYLGESRDPAELETTVDETLTNLRDQNMFKDVSSNVTMQGPTTAVIDLTIQPWFGIRRVSFTITVGDRV